MIQLSTPNILSLLIEAGADVNMRSRHGSPLFAAVIYGDVGFMNLPTEAGVDVNQMNQLGETPLHGSLKYFYSKADHAFHLLMDQDANINIPDNTGTTPLMLAARFCIHIQDMVRSG